MKIFDKPNTSDDWKCAICNTNDNKPVTLIPIYGTLKGGNIEAEQFHIDCIELTYHKDMNVLAQKI